MKDGSPYLKGRETVGNNSTATPNFVVWKWGDFILYWISFHLDQTNLIFCFAGETWKKVGAGGHNENKNIVNFYKSQLKFWKFLMVLWWYTSIFTIANLQLVLEVGIQCVLQALEYVFLAPWCLLQVKQTTKPHANKAPTIGMYRHIHCLSG